MLEDQTSQGTNVQREVQVVRWRTTQSIVPAHVALVPHKIFELIYSSHCHDTLMAICSFIFLQKGMHKFLKTHEKGCFS